MTALSEKRIGRFTASQFHKLMGPRGLGKTGESYVLEVLTEQLGGRLESFSSKATDWGNYFEPVAREYFEIAYSKTVGQKIIVRECDFAIYKEDEMLGASPDGWFFDTDYKQALIEIKCPYNLTEHVRNLSIKTQEDLKAVRFEYYTQIQIQLLCKEYEKAYFLSFCGYNEFEKLRLPYKPMHIVKVTQDKEFQKLILERLAQAKQLSNTLKSKIAS